MKMVITLEPCGIFGLNICIHINENKRINKQYIKMVYDGIQKEAIWLIRIWYIWIKFCIQMYFNYFDQILLNYTF